MIEPDVLTEETYDRLWKRLRDVSGYGYSKGRLVEPPTLAYAMELIAEIVRRHGTGLLQDIPPVVVDNADIPDIPF